MTIAAVEETEQYPQGANCVITPVKDIMMAVLWLCPHCGRYNVTKHGKEKIEQNKKHGSKKHPIRPVCEYDECTEFHPPCGRKIRLRSEDFDHGFAMVPWRKVSQRRNMMCLAEGLNMINRSSNGSQNITRGLMYREWNKIVGYTGKKLVPTPFKRWQDD